jgi:hypothetical protein
MDGVLFEFLKENDPWSSERLLISFKRSSFFVGELMSARGPGSGGVLYLPWLGGNSSGTV